MVILVENFDLGHGKPGILSMVALGKNVKGSQFFITTAPAQQFDGRNVVCGESRGSIFPDLWV